VGCSQKEHRKPKGKRSPTTMEAHKGESPQWKRRRGRKKKEKEEILLEKGKNFSRAWKRKEMLESLPKGLILTPPRNRKITQGGRKSLLRKGGRKRRKELPRRAESSHS